MLHHQGVRRRSVLVGSSVHNRRIERLLNDSHRCVTATFYGLFYYLEQNELLNPITEEHLFALHYVFLPRINWALKQFQAVWNDGGVHTEREDKLLTSSSLLEHYDQGIRDCLPLISFTKGHMSVETVTVCCSVMSCHLVKMAYAEANVLASCKLLRNCWL